ncbi:MAG TPA: hypothetical protein VH481_09700 [Nitrososphaeraceae archaeon]|jgi:hypothetical protein
MSDRTGIEASMDENDIKSYMQVVNKELSKKNQTCKVKRIQRFVNQLQQ